MTVQELAQWCDERKDDPNYQHRDKDWDAIDKLAQLSWDRLPADQKQKIIAVGVQYGLLKDKADIAIGLKNVIRCRFMAQTNLFALCKLLDKYKDVSLNTYLWPNPETGKWEEHNTHEEICNGFFVRKDPTIKSFKQFALDFSGYKERLLLVPRGGFKSSIDMADCVQWVICFPEVTMLILTGVLNLAKDFVQEVKDHFTLAD